MSSVYFTSDLHFDHHNLVDFRRGVHGVDLISTQDMNEWIVEKHNEVVKKKDDIVWILGDVSWSVEGLKYLNEMNGVKRLVLGNHDTEGRKLHVKEFLPYFESIHGALKKYDMIMTHVPIHPQELVFRWTHNVHGHIHHLERQIEDDRYLNVNIDVRKGYPTSLIQLREEMNGTTVSGGSDKG